MHFFKNKKKKQRKETYDNLGTLSYLKARVLSYSPRQVAESATMLGFDDRKVKKFSPLINFFQPLIFFSSQLKRLFFSLSCLVVVSLSKKFHSKFRSEKEEEEDVKISILKFLFLLSSNSSFSYSLFHKVDNSFSKPRLQL